MKNNLKLLTSSSICSIVTVLSFLTLPVYAQTNTPAQNNIKATDSIQDQTNSLNADSSKEINGKNATGNKETIQDIIQKANSGDAKSQAKLGIAYSEGHGVPLNLDLALEWMKKSADQNFAPAQSDLGNHYLRLKDYPNALTMFSKSAAQRYPSGSLGLGYMYEKGLGISSDPAQAAAWYAEAAIKGLPDAQLKLGNLYMQGTGVVKNESQAVAWWAKAADAGNTSAQMLLADAYSLGRGVDKDLSVAFKWIKKSADKGIPASQFALGEIYSKGITEGSAHVDIDRSQATAWYALASSQGYLPATLALANAYVQGYGVIRNLEHATSIYKQTADLGSMVAQHNYATFLETGIGTTQNKSAALEMYKKAQANGDKEVAKSIERLENELNPSATNSSTNTQTPSVK